MPALREKLSKVPLINYIDGDLYRKVKISKNNNTHIGLYTRMPNRKKDKWFFWVSAEEADILSEMGILLID